MCGQGQKYTPSGVTHSPIPCAIDLLFKQGGANGSHTAAARRGPLFTADVSVCRQHLLYNAVGEPQALAAVAEPTVTCLVSCCRLI